jgi:hypothetical protein
MSASAELTDRTMAFRSRGIRRPRAALAFATLIGAISFALGVAAAPPATKPLPLVQPADLKIEGEFLGPVGIQGRLADGQTFSELEYVNGSIAFNPAHQSLFVVGHDWGQHVAEISIPAAGGTAAVLQPFEDVLAGKLALIDPDRETKKIGGLFVTGSQLLVSGFTYYDGAANATSSHFSRSTSFSQRDVVGPVRVGTLNPGFYGGYFAGIPDEWQSALGGDLLVGQCCLAIVGRTSFGPAAFAVKSSDLVAGTNPVPAQPLVYYDEHHQTLGSWSNVTTANPVYNMFTTVKAVVIPNGSATALFFGYTGLGVPCYGAGTPDQSLDRRPLPGEPRVTYCYDPANSAKGTHAFPYGSYVWAYNLNDFAAARSKGKKPWEIKPYAAWEPRDLGGPLGATYDAASGRLFIASQGRGTIRVQIVRITSAR